MPGTTKWDSDESSYYLIFISSKPISKSILYDEKSIPWLKQYEVSELKTMVNWIRKILVEADPFSADQSPQETDYHIPFEMFYSRIKSKQGRISTEISYPLLKKKESEIPEVETSIFMRGRDYYVRIKESRLHLNSPVYDYQIVLYLSDGRGLKRILPSFKDTISVKIGQIDTCLCYLTPVR